MMPVDKKDTIPTVKDIMLITLTFILSLSQSIIEKYVITSVGNSFLLLVFLSLILLIVWRFLTNKQIFPVILAIPIILFSLFHFSNISVFLDSLLMEKAIHAPVEAPACRDNPVESHTIIFEVGNTSCAFVGNIAPGEKQSYTIGASIGQILTITTQGDVIVEVYDKSGQKILSGDASSSLKTSLMIALPYTITLSGNGDFKLKAEIP